MAGFVEVINQRNRMCEKFKECHYGCPLDNARDNMLCNDFIHKFPKKAEEIIMNWAKENPVKTNRDKFKEVFGVERIDNKCLFSGLDGCEEHLSCNECKYFGFWDKEYIEKDIKNE